MLDREWAAQCRALLGKDDDQGDAAEPASYNLVTPRSACPGCQAPIKAWQNIPVISYLVLGGHCANCAAPIGLRYPLVEAVTGLLSGYIAWHFGYGLDTAAALLVLWALVALTVIDIDRQLLPDVITLPLMWAGLLAAALVSQGPTAWRPDLASAVVGAAAGYLSLWSIYHLFRIITGKEGMGYGDFKLLAALGAWLGWQMLPVVIMLSAVVGAVTGIAMIVALGRDRQLPIPFGPYLAAAGLAAMLWGDRLMSIYL
jgi:leader peptidase (prepilin peptidase)/N-methyltransferase